MARITVRHIRGDAFHIGIRGHSIVVDQRTTGHLDSGPTPVELFVASLAACAAHYAHRYLVDNALPHQDLSVNCEWLMRAGTPPAVGSVRLHIVTPTDLPAQARQGLLAAVDRCTVRNSIQPPLPAVSVELDTARNAAVPTAGTGPDADARRQPTAIG